MAAHRPLLLPIVATALFAVVCARLGVWQLDRLAQRRAFNATLHQRLAGAPLPVSTLPRDTTRGHYHRVTARGRFDYAGQVALATRSNLGSPGVHLLTPLRLDDGNVVMVNRGWVYAPDAMTIDASKWREHEGDSVTVTGYAETWTGREAAPLPAARRVVRTLDSAAVARLVGAPVLPYFVAQTSDSARAADRVVRLGEPTLDEGSHQSYAIQWFSFALIGLIGGSLLVREELARRRAAS
jgi:surfeit locus 1 family protein